jgi:hypothetical protein
MDMMYSALKDKGEQMTKTGKKYQNVRWTGPSDLVAEAKSTTEGTMDFTGAVGPNIQSSGAINTGHSKGTSQGSRVARTAKSAKQAKGKSAKPAKGNANVFVRKT